MPEQSKAGLARLLVGRLPSCVRAQVVEDSEFCAKFDLKTKNIISLGEGFAFDRDELFAAIGQVAGSTPPLQIKADDGEVCTLEITDQDGPCILITRGRARVLSPLMVLACADSTLRLEALSALTRKVQLPACALDGWKAEVKRSALNPRKLDKLSQDVGATVAGFLSNLDDTVTSGRASIDDLMPTSMKYFNQLLPEPSTASDLSNYIHLVLAPHQESLFGSDIEQALSFALAFGASERLVPYHAFAQLDDALAVRALETANWLDPFSIVTSLSLCCDRFPRDSRFKTLGESFLDRLLADAIATKHACEVFSGLYLVAISRLTQLAEFPQPVYYRRLVAFGHASLCARVLLTTSISLDKFYQWCLENEGRDFFALSLLDKRDAPRWRPDWIRPSQMMNELIGRLLLLAERYPAAAAELRLRDRIAEFQGKLESEINPWWPLYPGPLEGTKQTDDPEVKLTDEIVRAIEKATLGKVGVQRCIGIVAVGPILEVPDDLISASTKELDRSAIPPRSEGGKQFLALLGGLAHLAGLKRSSNLANLVASLGLRATALPQDSYSLSEIVPEVLEAGAAFKTPEEQVDWLSNVVSSFAFSTEKADDAAVLVGLIDTLGKYDRSLAHKLLRARAVAGSLVVPRT